MQPIRPRVNAFVHPRRTKVRSGADFTGLLTQPLLLLHASSNPNPPLVLTTQSLLSLPNPLSLHKQHLSLSLSLSLPIYIIICTNEYMSLQLCE
ncbi:hypothetical protein RHGRI_009041 [Rhododendron griersonianum]|uniref:Uncharacterized protein n=1 Tax=Rhododendron griersonianum TaxID=479676 RepID=A0AAV6L2N1_9ERIC|nr:hypothetical protein RHGRI_009041 [Rhododendron griersonianum]